MDGPAGRRYHPWMGTPPDDELVTTRPAIDPWRRLRRCGLAVSAAKAPCRDECRKLIGLVDAITAARPDFAPAFATWRRRAEAELAATDLESLAGEARLEALAMGLRRLWMALAHAIADSALKSPPYLKPVSLPFGRSLSYVYERVASPQRLERRCQRRHPAVVGWDSRFSLFGSAMGALTTLLQVLPGHFAPAEGAMPRWDALCGYYETHRLFRLYDGRGVWCRRFRNATELFHRVATGKTDILFVEPSQYDWDQTIVAPPLLVRALRQRPADRPLAVILDTSLLGPMTRLGELLPLLGRGCPLLMVELRSGLKLDQEGLELANVGIVRLFTRAGEAALAPAERWRRRLRDARKIMGNALSLDEMALLDLPWFNDPARLEAFAAPVFAHNARLAGVLAGVDGLFARVAHPSLSPRAGWQWAESPFVIAHLRAEEDERTNHDLLESAIHHEVGRRGLTVQFGASFGFRHHRFEIVRPFGFARPDGGARGFLKVAMGHRAGPSCDGFIGLLREIAAYPDFAALRRAYPQIQPIRQD